MSLPTAAIGDVLSLVLADVASHYGRRMSAPALTAGLPLVNGHLPLEHLGLAAARAGLYADVVARDIVMLQPTDLPLAVLTRDGGAEIVWSLERAVKGATTSFTISMAGQAGQRSSISADEFATRATGYIIRIVPRAVAIGDDGAQRRALGKGWLWAAFRGSRRIYAEAIAATVAVNLLALAMPLYTMNVYDRVLPNAATETLWALSIGVILATLFDLVIKLLRGTLVDAASGRADVVLANFIYGRLLGARLSETPPAAGVRANTLREFETLREFLNSATLTTFGDLPFVILFVGMVGVVAGPLVFILLAGIPILLGLGWLTQRTLRRLSENQFTQTAQRNAIAVETLIGLETLKSAGAESFAATLWERSVADGVRTSLKIRKISNKGQNAIFAAQTIIQVAMVMAGFYLVVAGSITSGALIAGTMLAGRALQPLSQMAMLIARLHQTRIAYRSLSEIVHAPQERPDTAQFLSEAPTRGAITFDAVSFSYQKDAPPALRDVSFQIEAGERVAIVGVIGTGKTTVLKLIQALFLPQAGRVLVDGLPVSQIDPVLLRRATTMALQDAELFQGTIRSNIALADPTASDVRILAAAENAGALEWIMRLPKGLDTPVRERGSGLSGGQRQSVTLARALLADACVVLLDEPTSDMDARTEQAVLHRLRGGLDGRTLVLVTHRPALLELVDRMIVLDDGRKLLDGPKGAVLAALGSMGKKSAAAADARGRLQTS